MQPSRGETYPRPRLEHAWPRACVCSPGVPEAGLLRVKKVAEVKRRRMFWYHMQKLHEIAISVFAKVYGKAATHVVCISSNRSFAPSVKTIVYSPLSLKSSLSGLVLRNYSFFISQPLTLLSPTAWPPARHCGPFSLLSSELGSLLSSSPASSRLHKSPQIALIILSHGGGDGDGCHPSRGCHPAR